MSDLPRHEVPAGASTDRWSLTVRGSVSRPREFDVDDLRPLQTETFTADFECEVGWVAEDVSWSGVGVAELLDRVEPTPNSEYALVHAMDGEYACSLPLQRLRRAVLALELDGDRLPVEHGGPARLVPTDEGDCWESVKWVEAIELTSERPDDTAREIALGRFE